MSALTYSSVGKEVRLRKILQDGKAVIFAFDHGVEHGPSDFPPYHINPEVILSKVVKAGIDAIMMLPGMARLTHRVWGGKVALIIKVSSKTNLRPENEKLLQSVFGYVEDAVSLGADAVAATVYWGSPFEDLMLERWFAVREAAETYGYPALQLAYPRGPEIKDRYHVEIVRYGARAAAESGADIIKTYFTGSEDTFAEVVKAASGVPVLMSGGPKTSTPLEFLQHVKAVMNAGGKGVVVGRNIFQSDNPEGMVKAIAKTVHEGLEPGEAVKYLSK